MSDRSRESDYSPRRVRKLRPGLRARSRRASSATRSSSAVRSIRSRQFVAAAMMMRTIRTPIQTKLTTEAGVAAFLILVMPHPLARSGCDCFPLLELGKL
jgi:hypothetical protein